MIEFNGFTEKASLALNKAVDSAMLMGHTYIGSEHILYGLAAEKMSTAQLVLRRHGVNETDIMTKMELAIGRGVRTKLSLSDFTPRGKSVLSQAYGEAKKCGSEKAGTEHILAALATDEKSYGSIFLKELGVNTAAVADECLHGTVQRADPSPYSPAGKVKSSLAKYGRDLTEMALKGQIDPVVARDGEIESVISVLLRRRKNNPCLTGESGVGKTAVVEGLALRIVSGDVPEELRNRRIFSLDLAAMLAGAKYRGDFEERIKNAMDEVTADGKIIVFIDELHNIMGAGAAEGAIDAANILKPVLARGELRLIGATTAAEYRKYIEKDAALERRFQPINVREPSESSTVAILSALRDRYEAHHGVRITDEAIRAAVSFSVRYIPDRYLPDKAIDLVDEAAALARMRGGKTEADGILERLRLISAEKEKAVAEQCFDKAGEILAAEKSLGKRYEELKKEKKEPTEITESDIAAAVSRRSGIPVGRLCGNEAEKLAGLEEELKKRVVGQDSAVKAVAAAIRRGRTGLKRRSTPIGSFVFLGPTGVGKTELAKALAEIMFDDKNALIRLDMSEYMERHSVSRLIGPPPGYVGFEEGGQLTERVRRNPYSVVLLDEIEKAHSDVSNLLLQILDDGTLTASDGRKVSFSNTVIIMTGNLGARYITEQSAVLGFSRENAADAVKSRVLGELKKHFSPELLNRIDETPVFSPLSQEAAQTICGKMAREVSAQAARSGLTLTFTDEAVSLLARLGYDSRFGARPLRRTITERVENPLSEMLISGKTEYGDRVTVSVSGDEILLQSESARVDG